LQYGKFIQNVFTVAKTGALLGLIVVGLVLGYNVTAVNGNLAAFWQAHPDPKATFHAFWEPADLPGLTAVTALGLFVAVCVSQTGSLFSSDAWNNITFTAGEVRQPRRNIPLALALGTGLVITLYLLANVAYLVTLPFSNIQHTDAADSDRVGTATLEHIFPGGTGAMIMAAAIMVSTFGCNNGLILAGARTYYAMARDGVFFKVVGRLNPARVPAWGLLVQGIWAALLVLPRAKKPDGSYGPLYNDLLEYVICAALVFYILTIAGIFRLRITRPDAPRPYKAFGYPIIPALYILSATTIIGVLVAYKPMTTWPGLVLVVLGVPVYYLWTRRRR
jgi:APA family basic amino acid/polyamine antiporter